MAAKYLMLSDVKNRSLVYRRESMSNIYNCLYNEHLIYSNWDKLDAIHEPFFHYAHYLLMKRHKFSMFKSRVRNRCVISGNARAVHKRFKMSRFPFKMYSRNGNINGISKASW